MTNPLKSVRNSIAIFGSAIAFLETGLKTPALGDAITSAADLIYKMHGRLILTGVGKSGHIARKLSATFSSTGTPSYFVHPTEASHGDLGLIQNDDVVMLMSWSGETRELSDIVAYCARFNVPMISITRSKDCTLAQKAQVTIVLPQTKEACPHNLAPTTSTLLQMAIGDALAVALLEMRGFSESSFKAFHPGGKLGAALTPLSDIMHMGNRLPLLPQTAPMIEVISMISAKGFGIVGLLDGAGGIVGVITDGDIRRFLETNTSATLDTVLNSTFATEIMTKNCVTLEPDWLSAKALHVLQSNKISAAFVAEHGKPKGIVTVLQLLDVGVV